MKKKQNVVEDVKSYADSLWELSRELERVSDRFRALHAQAAEKVSNAKMEVIDSQFIQISTLRDLLVKEFPINHDGQSNEHDYFCRTGARRIFDAACVHVASTFK